MRNTIGLDTLARLALTGHAPPLPEALAAFQAGLLWAMRPAPTGGAPRRDGVSQLWVFAVEPGDAVGEYLVAHAATFGGSWVATNVETVAPVEAVIADADPNTVAIPP